MLKNFLCHFLLLFRQLTEFFQTMDYHVLMTNFLISFGIILHTMLFKTFIHICSPGSALVKQKYATLSLVFRFLIIEDMILFGDILKKIIGYYIFIIIIIIIIILIMILQLFFVSIKSPSCTRVGYFCPPGPVIQSPIN